MALIALLWGADLGCAEEVLRIGANDRQQRPAGAVAEGSVGVGPTIAFYRVGDRVQETQQT